MSTQLGAPKDANGVTIANIGISAGTGYAVPSLDVFTKSDSATGQVHAITLVTSGGSNSTPVAAGTSADTVIKASAGRLCKVLITTLGTNALLIYDNASGHTGTIIGCVAASATAGTLVDLQMPAANGITVAGNSNNPAFTVSWS